MQHTHKYASLSVTSSKYYSHFLPRNLPECTCRNSIKADEFCQKNSKPASNQPTSNSRRNISSSPNTQLIPEVKMRAVFSLVTLLFFVQLAAIQAAPVIGEYSILHIHLMVACSNAMDAHTLYPCLCSDDLLCLFLS